MTERLGTDPAYSSHENIGTSNQRVQALLTSLRLNLVNDGLEFLIRGFAAEEAGEFLAFSCKRGIYNS